MGGCLLGVPTAGQASGFREGEMLVFLGVKCPQSLERS